MSDAQEVVEDLSELPDGVREELELNGIETGDLSPGLSGVRDEVQREDLARFVDAVLDLVDGPVGISVGPCDRPRSYRVEWHRVEPDDWGSWGEFRPALEEREAGR